MRTTLVSCMMMLSACTAFHLPAAPVALSVRAPAPRMGFFDRIKKAFENEDFGNPAMYEQTNARASHILVKSEEDALKIKEDIDTGRLEFSEAAMRFSTCNSASQGGRLGKFTPGQMVAEFDDVIFGVVDNGVEYRPKTELNTVVGPVKTQFGYHLITISPRVMADFDFRAREGQFAPVEKVKD